MVGNYTIRNARRDIDELLRPSPGLKMPEDSPMERAERVNIFIEKLECGKSIAGELAGQLELALNELARSNVLISPGWYEYCQGLISKARD